MVILGEYSTVVLSVISSESLNTTDKEKAPEEKSPGACLSDVTCDTLVGKTLGHYPLTLRLDIFRWPIGESSSPRTRRIEGVLRRPEVGRT